MKADEPATAIVTGAAKRVGADITQFLLAEGWTVVAHVRREQDEVAAGAVKAVADLAGTDCCQKIFAAAESLPPVRLLVNNASRFRWDGFGEFSTSEFEAHMAVNVRAPLLLAEKFAAVQTGDEDSLIVNVLDSKLAAPNPDFLSYTLSKQALAGLTMLAARAFAARRIRVNGIAPALMLRSAGQSEENFRIVHARNPLRRGVESSDVVSAIDFLIRSPAVTGQILTLDAGQHFDGPPRDVQFLEA